MSKIKKQDNKNSSNLCQNLNKDQEIKNCKFLLLKNLKLIKTQILQFKAEIENSTNAFILQKQNQIRQIKQQLQQLQKTQTISVQNSMSGNLMLQMLQKQLQEKKTSAQELKKNHFLFVQRAIKEAEDNYFEIESIIQQIEGIHTKRQSTEIQQIKIQNTDQLPQDNSSEIINDMLKLNLEAIKFSTKIWDVLETPPNSEKLLDKQQFKLNAISDEMHYYPSYPSPPLGTQQLKDSNIESPLCTIPPPFCYTNNFIPQNNENQNNNIMLQLKNSVSDEMYSDPSQLAISSPHTLCPRVVYYLPQLDKKIDSLCLINHEVIDQFIDQYQVILQSLFTKVQATNSLSLKCFCGKKLCLSHIIEPRNRIFFESLMENQLDVLIRNQPHLKCNNISCNFKVVYDAKVGQKQSHYYCQMCNEKCLFLMSQ